MAVSTTPAGIQSTAEISRRRSLVLALNTITYLGLAFWLGSILGAQGWSAVDVALFGCFLAGTPWAVLGFWNAVIGLWLLRATKDPILQVAPCVAAGGSEDPLRVDTAILLTLRNEDPARALKRLRIVKQSIDATGAGDRFSYFILSDTNDAVVAIEEEAMAHAWALETGAPHRVVYRRRTDNEGFKAGNVRDFCTRWGGSFELMLPLDADSLMTGDTIVRMVRMMQAYPKLGILQSLVTGMPSKSGFARIFQFGMRHGMRPYTMGSAWWMADCGPFWGHNALVRVKPFIEDCDLPVLPGNGPLGGHVLSHDQVEAALMRRAGYEVRVWPEECGSWEENPPTLADFSRRDVRWCQGNLQYMKLLGLPGLLPMSRFQLAFAILMFLGIPAWTLLIALLPFKVLDGESSALFPAASAAALYLTFLMMYLSPKLAGFADVLATKRESGRYGGAGLFLAGAAVELVFSFLVGAATTLRITLFMLGLPFGRSATWNGQERDVHALSWRSAVSGLWPQFLFGMTVIGALTIVAPALVLWSLPLTLGYLVAIPFAVWTSRPAVGRFLVETGLCAIPEEDERPWEIAALGAPPVAHCEVIETEAA
ncbi:glucans biosynthesis glucosyltransferase MdoH [Microvirga brassicacearum]|uniref:Glucans biosynthesis glucosyltransferase H n=1 Tax=Microvirga brassicacearum TaxID=2580413 RepID=A0A5N3PDC8_9HYPH|nr:glucans biosynthesis glucosyltransferase MdoH [Microvirga brassicacearum]